MKDALVTKYFKNQACIQIHFQKKRKQQSGNKEKKKLIDNGMMLTKMVFKRTEMIYSNHIKTMSLMFFRKKKKKYYLGGNKWLSQYPKGRLNRLIMMLGSIIEWLLVGQRKEDR